MSEPDMFAEEEEPDWSGVLYCSLPRLGPGCELPAQCPAPRPSSHHTVGVALPLDMAGPQPHPATLTDRWDGEHVRLPWSRDNLYPVEVEPGTRKVLMSRWDLIIESLTKYRLTSSHELEAAVLRYNTRYSGHQDWSFSALHKLFSEEFSTEETENFFQKVLPKMVDLLISSPNMITCPLPLLTAGRTRSITLSQQQISVLLVNAFFCTFPRRNARNSNAEFSSFPHINFNTLFGLNHRREEAHLDKLKCLLSYFSQVVTNTRTGLVTFTRKSLTGDSLPDWRSCQQTLTGLHLTSTGFIETEGAGMLQADFANRFVGGGVLSSGLVQEEIRFTVCPELIASMLFTEVLGDTEVLYMIGAEQFSSYSGYGDTFTFSGRFQDSTELDSAGRRQTTVVAMDAIRFSRPATQYTADNVNRELNKAFTAFSNDYTDRLTAVATGNWGCGAFNGDCRVKFIIQLLAASVSGRDVAYFTFGDEELVRDGGEIWDFMVKNEVTVGQVYRLLMEFGESQRQRSGQELFRWIYQNVRKLKMEREAYNAETDEEEENIETTESCKSEKYSQSLPSVDNEEVKGTENDQDSQSTSTVDIEEKKEERKLENDQNIKVRTGGFFATLDRMERGELQSSPTTPAPASQNVGKEKAQLKMTDFFK